MNYSVLRRNPTDKIQSGDKTICFVQALVPLDSNCSDAGFYYKLN